MHAPPHNPVVGGHAMVGVHDDPDGQPDVSPTVHGVKDDTGGKLTHKPPHNAVGVHVDPGGQADGLPTVQSAVGIVKVEKHNPRQPSDEHDAVGPQVDPGGQPDGAPRKQDTLVNGGERKVHVPSQPEVGHAVYTSHIDPVGQSEDVLSMMQNIRLS